MENKKLIDKIHYKLTVGSNVDKQPTISVGCYVIAHIYFKDGRVFEDVEITWDDVPYLVDEIKFTKEELKEINILINSYDNGLWKGVCHIAEEINKLSVINSIKTEE